MLFRSVVAKLLLRVTAACKYNTISGMALSVAARELSQSHIHILVPLSSYSAALFLTFNWCLFVSPLKALHRFVSCLEFQKPFCLNSEKLFIAIFFSSLEAPRERGRQAGAFLLRRAWLRWRCNDLLAVLRHLGCPRLRTSAGQPQRQPSHCAFGGKPSSALSPSRAVCC